MYAYKNGMRYIVEDKAKEGYHFHNDIAVKIGKNTLRILPMHVDGRLGAGVPVSLKTKLSTINCVKLNSCKLTPHIDYAIDETENNIVFTFNLSGNDRVEIEGLI